MSSTRNFLGLPSDAFKERESRENTLINVYAITGSTNELANPHKMDSCLLLRIRVFYQTELGLGFEIGNLGDRNKVVDLVALILEMKTGIAKCCRQVDNGLADLVDLLLRRDLKRICY